MSLKFGLKKVLSPQNLMTYLQQFHSQNLHFCFRHDNHILGNQFGETITIHWRFILWTLWRTEYFETDIQVGEKRFFNFEKACSRAVWCGWEANVRIHSVSLLIFWRTAFASAVVLVSPDWCVGNLAGLWWQQWPDQYTHLSRHHLCNLWLSEVISGIVCHQ